MTDLIKLADDWVREELNYERGICGQPRVLAAKSAFVAAATNTNLVADQAWIAEVRARAEKATPGPWTRVPQTQGGDMIAREYETGNQMNPKGLRMIAFMMARGNSLKEDEANATLIAHARTDIPRLLSEIDRLAHRAEGDVVGVRAEVAAP